MNEYPWYEIVEQNNDIEQGDFLDAPPDPTCAAVPCTGGDARDYFGLWRADRTPKAAVAILADLIPDGPE